MRLFFWSRAPRYHGKTIAGWLRQLRSRFFRRQYRAQKILARLKGNTEGVLRGLVATVRDQRAQHCHWLAKLALELPSLDGVTIGDELDEAFRDDSLEVRVAVASLLWQRDGNTSAIWPTVMEGLASDDEGICQNAHFTIALIGPEAAPAVPTLIAHLQDDKKRNCWWTAASTLGAFGPQAKEATPYLIERLRKTDLWVEPDIIRSVLAQSVRSALARCSSESVAVLLLALNDSDADVRAGVANALAQAAREAIRRPTPVVCGPESFRPALPVLRRALDDPELEVRFHAARAIWSLSGDVYVLRHFGSALQHSDADVRKKAAEELGEAGFAASTFVPNLQNALRDVDQYVRFEAAVALWRITGAASAALPVILDKLKDVAYDLEHFPTSELAVLAEMGPAAKPAVRVLRKLARKTWDPAIREKVLHTLAKIE